MPNTINQVQTPPKENWIDKLVKGLGIAEKVLGIGANWQTIRKYGYEGDAAKNKAEGIITESDVAGAGQESMSPEEYNLTVPETQRGLSAPKTQRVMGGGELSSRVLVDPKREKELRDEWKDRSKITAEMKDYLGALLSAKEMSEKEPKGNPGLDQAVLINFIKMNMPVGGSARTNEEMIDLIATSDSWFRERKKELKRVASGGGALREGDIPKIAEVATRIYMDRVNRQDAVDEQYVKRAIGLGLRPNQVVVENFRTPFDKEINAIMEADAKVAAKTEERRKQRKTRAASPAPKAATAGLSVPQKKQNKTVFTQDDEKRLQHLLKLQSEGKRE